MTGVKRVRGSRSGLNRALMQTPSQQPEIQSPKRISEAHVRAKPKLQRLGVDGAYRFIAALAYQAEHEGTEPTLSGASLGLGWLKESMNKKYNTTCLEPGSLDPSPISTRTNCRLQGPPDSCYRRRPCQVRRRPKRRPRPAVSQRGHTHQIVRQVSFSGFKHFKPLLASNGLHPE